MVRLTTETSTNTSKEDATKMFEYFLASENRQTYFYTGLIASLKHLIKEYENDLDGLESACEDALRVMYLSEYPYADIIVKTEPKDNGELYKILFSIKLRDENNESIDVLRDFTLDQYINGDNAVYKKELL